MYISLLHGKKDDLYSIRIKIWSNKEKVVYNGLGLKDSIFLPCELKDNTSYSFIISVVSCGKQIFKNIYTFTYHKDVLNRFDSFIISDNGNVLNDKKYYINPIVIDRVEGSRTSVYLKGNIYLLKGDLRKTYTVIKNHGSVSSLNKEDIDLLIDKGVVITYGG